MKNCIMFFFAVCLLSCNQKVDFSNPKDVVKNYFELIINGKFEKSFELIASNCKKMVLIEDYKTSMQENDSLMHNTQYQLTNIKLLPFDPNYPKFRRLEIKYTAINTANKDTFSLSSYSTTFNENGTWKIIWVYNLTDAAERLEEYQKFYEAISLYKKILDLSPFDVDANQQISWCYVKLNENDQALNYANRAIELNPNHAINFNLLSNIYLNQGKYDLAIENLNKALKMTSDLNQSVYLLSNIAIAYSQNNEKAKAKIFINKALKIDPNDTHSLWTLGRLLVKENKKDSAIICFKKIESDKNKNLSDFMQKQYYFDFAETEYQLYQNSTRSLATKKELLVSAKNHVVKALNLDIENIEYKQLLDVINVALKKT